MCISGSERIKLSTCSDLTKVTASCVAVAIILNLSCVEHLLNSSFVVSTWT